MVHNGDGLTISYCTSCNMIHNGGTGQYAIVLQIWAHYNSQIKSNIKTTKQTITQQNKK